MLERLRQIIRDMEKRGAVVRPLNGAARGSSSHPGEPAIEAARVTTDGATAPSFSLPAPGYVGFPRPGVKLVKYELRPGDYPGLEPCEVPDDLVLLMGDRAAEVRGTGASPVEERRCLSRPLFLDIETTALGGAGALPFLVGVGRWEEGNLLVTQFLLQDRSSEAWMLELLAAELESAVLVTFNGKCFDVPVLRDRFILSATGPFPVLRAHIDLYVIARRLGRKPGYRFSLTQCESRYLGLSRPGDIPSRMVPALYFMYEKDRDESVLAPVLRHNLMDVAAMASLVTVFGDILTAGTRCSHDPEALFGAAKMHLAARRYHMARACLEGAMAWPCSPVTFTPEFRQVLADVLWKMGERDRASEILEELMIRGCLHKDRFSRLSSHYEASGDLERALEVVERGLAGLKAGRSDRRLVEVLERRAGRLRTKLERSVL